MGDDSYVEYEVEVVPDTDYYPYRCVPLHRAYWIKPELVMRNYRLLKLRWEGIGVEARFWRFQQFGGTRALKSVRRRRGVEGRRCGAGWPVYWDCVRRYGLMNQPRIPRPMR